MFAPMWFTPNATRPTGPAPWGRIFALFRPHLLKVVAAVLTIVVSSSISVVSPLLIREMFDHALFCGADAGCPNQTRVLQIGALMLVIPVASSLMSVLQGQFSNRVGQAVVEKLRNQLYVHLQGLSLRFFTSTRTGEIQSRLSNDVGGVQGVVTGTAGNAVTNSVLLVSTVVAMVTISWPLTLLSLFMLPVFALLTQRVGHVRRWISRQSQESKAEMTSITQETLSVSGILLTRVFDRHQYEIERYRRENRHQAELTLREVFVGQMFFLIIQVFFGITPALLYLAVGLAMTNHLAVLSAGTVVAFSALQARMYNPVNTLLQMSVQVQSSLALFQRIFEYLDLETDIVDAPDAIALAPSACAGHVWLEDVHFRYDRPPPDDSAAKEAARAWTRRGARSDPSGRRRSRKGAGNGALSAPQPVLPEDPLAEERLWALRGVSLHVRPGQLAAIVGPSGAGKTTLSYLVPRLYDVTRGAVRLDGRDVRTIQQRSLAQMVGMVTQESYLFHATIRANLLYGRPDATQEEIERAARAALIHDRIVAFPDGYDTVVGERGYRLSGGEKQRIAIARVILKDPPILILDEATSSLDTASERLVQSALRPLMEGRTTIAIAHRLSTIQAADVIFVLDRGRVAERGTHHELLALGGLYALLYRQQFQESEVPQNGAARSPLGEDDSPPLTPRLMRGGGR